MTDSGDFADSGQTGMRTVTVNAGSSATISVTTDDDSADETDGTFTATVQSGAGYTVATPSSASVDVADNDLPSGNSATVTVSVAGPVERVGPGVSLEFLISLSETAQQDVTVDVSVSSLGGGGLLPGIDYWVRGWAKNQTAGQVIIGEGNSKVALFVEFDDDAWIRSAGQILVHLTAVEGAKAITQAWGQGGFRP